MSNPNKAVRVAAFFGQPPDHVRTFHGIRSFNYVLCLCHHDGSDWILDFSTALIPFAEFRQQEVMENYEVELDPEVVEVLDTAIKKSHVCFFDFYVFFF